MVSTSMPSPFVTRRRTQPPPTTRFNHAQGVLYIAESGDSVFTNISRVSRMNSRMQTRIKVTERVVLCVCIACAPAACSTTTRLPDHAALGQRERIVADWNDTDAAVDLAASNSEMAVVSMGTNDTGERVYVLRTIRDEPAWLTLRRTRDAEQSAPLEITARVGRFGDSGQEYRLLRELRRRLTDLHGVATSPIR